MGYAFSSLDELGEGYGFRKIRRGLGVTAFGANALVMPPGFDGFLHYHDTQDELYFVHQGTARFEVDGEARELGPGEPRPRRVDDAAEVLERRRRRPGRDRDRRPGRLRRARRAPRRPRSRPGAATAFGS